MVIEVSRRVPTKARCCSGHPMTIYILTRVLDESAPVKMVMTRVPKTSKLLFRKPMGDIMEDLSSFFYTVHE